jgi:anti-anti-sigma regulatory factor
MATDPSHFNDAHSNGSHSKGSPVDGNAGRLNFTLRLGGSDPERVIFFLGGDLLGPSCLPFEHFSQRCIDCGTRRLRLDLSGLRSLDLDGVNALVAVHQRLAAVGGRLFLTNANPEVRSVLRLFGRPLLATDTSVVFTPGGNPPSESGARRQLAG